MKRRDIIRKLEEHGFHYLRPGHNHDIYTNGKVNIPIPRHREVKELMAKQIFREAGIPE